jgi:hypothetical protein
LPGNDARPASGLPFPQQQVPDIARVADANNGLIVGGKLKTIPIVPKDLIAKAMADGIAIVGLPSCLDFRPRRVHEDDQETTAIVVRNLPASIA